MLREFCGKGAMDRLLAFTFCCILASACSQVDQLEGNVRGLERKLSDIRAQQAEQTTQIGALDARLRELAGVVQELQHSQRVGSPVVPAGSVAVAPASQQLPPPIVPLATLEADEMFAAGLARPAAGRAFLEALAGIRGSRFSEALVALQRAQEQNLQDEGSAQILFWKGVCHDALGDNRRALAAYGELISTFPKHPRTALGLLRQGSVFVRLGDVGTAQLTLQKLIAEFPQSPEAGVARQRLREI